MKKITLLGVTAGLCMYTLLSTFPIYGQLPGSLSSKWEVSDNVPLDITLQNVVNYNSNKLSFKDYQNQLVILDFWNTFCTACIKAWPKLDSLQRKFQGRILILLVTQEATDSIQKFVAKRQQAMGITLSMPIVTADTLLSKLVPAKFNPYYAWIEPGGQVIGLTNSYMLTEEAVEQTLLKVEAYRPQRQRQLQAFEDAKKRRVARQLSDKK